MELISFGVATALGLILTFYSIKEKSYVFGIIAGLFFLMIGISILVNGLDQQMITIVVNSTGDVNTTYVTKELFNDDVFTTALLGLFFLAISIFMMFSSALEIYEQKA